DLIQNITVTFSSNDYSDALSAITNADVTNLESVDMDGFLAIRNRNSGGTHYLKIKPQVDPDLEAALVLGFAVDPYPGSISYAGEVASTPGVRRQSNPQGTVLIGKDEDLNSSSFNRAMMAILQYLEKDKIDLDREILVIKEVA